MALSKMYKINAIGACVTKTLIKQERCEKPQFINGMKITQWTQVII